MRFVPTTSTYPPHTCRHTHLRQEHGGADAAGQAGQDAGLVEHCLVLEQAAVVVGDLEETTGEREVRER